MRANSDAAFWIVFAVVYVIALYFQGRAAWRMYRNFPGVKTFQFYILDTLAAVFGLSPSAWLAAQAVKHIEENGWNVEMPLLVGLVFISQIVGLFLGRVHGTVPPQEPPNEWIDALWVMGGAFLGLGILAFYFAIFIILWSIAVFSWQFGMVVFFIAMFLMSSAAYKIYITFW